MLPDWTMALSDLLVRNDPLDAVWRESERGLDFVRKARYRDIADTIVSQQRFIAVMQGRTATFSTFSDAQFDEAAFEAQLGAYEPSHSRSSGDGRIDDAITALCAARGRRRVDALRDCLSETNAFEARHRLLTNL